MLVEKEFITKRYNRIVTTLPSHLQEAAKRLPFRLGLVDSIEGKWEEYTKLPLMYDMPGVVIDILQDLGLQWGKSQREAYRVLHLYTLLYFICRDRIADGDTLSDDTLEELIEYWKSGAFNQIRTLSTNQNEQLFYTYVQQWEQGVSHEQKAVASKVLTWEVYGSIIGQKNRYLLLSCSLLLTPYVVEKKQIMFILEGVIIALQCREDALRAEEDALHFGSSFPQLLQTTENRLYNTAMIILNKMQVLSQSFQYTKLAELIQEILDQEIALPFDTLFAGSHLFSLLHALRVFPPLTTM